MKLSTSKKSDLKTAINDKFSKQSLSEKQLSKLHGLLSQERESKQSPLSRSWYVAAGLALGLFAIFIVGSLPKQLVDMPQLIASEVVRNHLKLKPVEVATSSFSDIRSYFDKLKFSPIRSGNVSDISKLLGGRYCSLQGYKAAQLQIKNTQSNEIDTLYQVPYMRGTFGDLPNIDNGENPIVVYERGIKVSIWVEKGVLFARTHMGEAK